MTQQASSSTGDLRTRLFGTYFLNHERMLWKLGDIAWDSIDRGKLDDQIIQTVHATMLVESHNPVYASVLLNKMRQDIAATDFLAVWTYEESKHFAGLQAYLEAVRGAPDPAMVAELQATRAGEWEIPGYYTDLMVAAYTMMQEHVTGMFYRNFAQRVEEPVLTQLLSLIGKDEFRHHRFYYEYARQRLVEDPSRVAEVDTAIEEFQMPGPGFIPNYQYHALAMADSGDLGIGTYKDVLGVVRRLVGDDHLRELASTGFRPQNSWLRHAFELTSAADSASATRAEQIEARRRTLLRRARLASA
jgi:hypothetical protein